MRLILSSSEETELCSILNDLFTTVEDFDKVVYIAFGKTLDQMTAEGSNLTVRVSLLVREAQKDDEGIGKLLEAACEARPSKRLHAFYDKLQTLGATGEDGTGKPGPSISAAERAQALQRAAASLGEACQHFEKMRKYKEIHDAAQVVDGAYWPLRDQVFDASDIPKPADQINWPALNRLSNPLVLSIQKLCSYVRPPSTADSGPSWLPALAESARDWSNRLQEGAGMISKANREKSIDTMADGMLTVYGVTGPQEEWADAKLMDETQNLRLGSLISALRAAVDPDDQQASRFAGLRAIRAADVQALDELNVRLERLQKQHHAWQKIDTKMREAQLTLNQGANIYHLNWLWQRDLRTHLQERCEDPEDDWGGTLTMAPEENPREQVKQAIEVFHTKLTALPPTSTMSLEQKLDLSDALYGCWSAGNKRFVEVDWDLKMLCDALVEKGLFWQEKLRSVG